MRPFVQKLIQQFMKGNLFCLIFSVTVSSVFNENQIVMSSYSAHALHVMSVLH